MAGSKTNDSDRCPAPQQLSAVLHLSSTDPLGRGLREHLLQCSSCQQLLDQFTAAPELAAMLPSKSAIGSTEAESLNQVKRRIRGILLGPEKFPGAVAEKPGAAAANLSQRVSFAAPQVSEAVKIDNLETAENQSQATLAHSSHPGDGASELPFRIGPFDILSRLGAGGMGNVYLAFDSRLNRKVAIKTIRYQRRELRERLIREAEAAGRIDSAQVVRLYALDEDETGNLYLVMEYVEGETLAERIARDGKLDLPQAVSVMLATCQGVQAAHDCGVLHRDIKPANILLDQQGQVKVSDFGLAAFMELGPRLTRDNVVPGTPAYLSPELARGARPSVASDLYGLGCVLYECLTGEPALQGSPLEILRRLAEGDLPSLPLAPGSSRYGADKSEIPRPLAVICNCAMAAEPAQRYGQVSDLIEDLRRWQRGEPIAALPETWLQKNCRRVARHPRRAIGFGLSAVAILLMAGYAGWATWQGRVDQRRAQQATQEVEVQKAEANRQRSFALQQLQESIFQVQDLLRNRAGTLESRKSLLLSALQGLEQIIGPDNQSQVDRSTALAYLRLGQVQLALGDHGEGRKSLQRAKDMAELWPLDSPTDARTCRDTAAILASLGDAALSQRNHAEAQAHFEAALELRQAALQIDPEDPTAYANYAMNLVRLGDVAKATGQLETAENYFQQVAVEVDVASERFPQDLAIKRISLVAIIRLTVMAMAREQAAEANTLANQWRVMAQDLLQREPTNVEYQSDNALGLAQLARIRLLQDDFDGACDFASQASAAYQAIAETDSDSALAQSRFATSLHAEGEAWYSRGDFDTAHQRWQQAATIHDQLFQQYPSNTRYALLGGESRMWLGLVDLTRGEIESGLASLQRALATLTAGEAGTGNDPNTTGPNAAVRNLVEQFTLASELLEEDQASRLAASPSVSLMSGYLLARTDELEFALPVAEHWASFRSSDVAEMVNVHSLRAAIYSLAAAQSNDAEQARWRNQALDALQTTLIINPAWRSIMRKSPDFLALRNDPDYQNLVAGMPLSGPDQ